MPVALRRLLTDDQLKRLHERAARYDLDNTFFAEDLDELREIGYLAIAVPEELGGHGYRIDEVLAEQRRLAYWAPATALGVNMHLYWTGPAADLYNRGDHRAEWLLEEVAAGKVIAAGHGEPGNDLVIDDSTTAATPVDGGYRFTGHKIFTSLSPAWDWLGVHGRDDTDPENPKIVHAFIRRDAEGITARETWDTLGVRATASHDTLLDGAFAAGEHVIAVHDLGGDLGPYVEGIFPWVLPAIGNIYYGIGRRAVDLAIDVVKVQTSLALSGATRANKPLAQYHVAEAELLLEAVGSQLDLLGIQLGDGTDLGSALVPKLFAAKENGTQAGRKAVDLALQIAGASSLHKRSELERLYRDVRAGTFHPPNTDAVHETIGKAVLGLL